MDFAVIGGGEFGSYHARQLLKTGAGRVLVVDRDPACAAFRSLSGVEPVVGEWSDFLSTWLREGQSSPLVGEVPARRAGGGDAMSPPPR